MSVSQFCYDVNHVFSLSVHGILSCLYCRVCAHENVNKQDHCTISIKGCTRMRADDETEFVPFDRWEQEYGYFEKLVKVGVLTVL